MNAKGFTLIELVAIIVVAGLAIPALLTGWANLSLRSVQSEALADASLYATELVEEIATKRFDEAGEAPWTQAGLFGGGRTDESDEDGRGEFDDVDDYHGYNDTVSGFLRQVSVSYVALSGNTWQDSPAVTDFKRIQVRVGRQAPGIGNVTMVTMSSAY